MNDQNEMIAKFLLNLVRWRDFCTGCAEFSKKDYATEFAAWKAAYLAGGSSRETIRLLQRADHSKRVITEAACGIALVARVVSEPELIKVWVDQRVEIAAGKLVSERGILRRPSDQVDDDYRTFVELYGLYDTFVPDNGSVLCGLHELADRAAGVTETHYYH